MQAFIMISHSSLDQKRSLISLAVLLAYFHLHFLCHHLQLHRDLLQTRLFSSTQLNRRSLVHLRHAPQARCSTYLLDLACCWGAGVEGYLSTLSSNQGEKLNTAEPSMVNRIVLILTSKVEGINVPTCLRNMTKARWITVLLVVPQHYINYGKVFYVKNV